MRNIEIYLLKFVVKMRRKNLKQKLPFTQFIYSYLKKKIIIIKTNIKIISF